VAKKIKEIIEKELIMAIKLKPFDSYSIDKIN